MRLFLIFRELFLIFISSRLGPHFTFLVLAEGIIFGPIENINRFLAINTHVEPTIFIISIMQPPQPALPPPPMLLLQILYPFLRLPYHNKQPILIDAILLQSAGFNTNLDFEYLSEQ